MKVINSLPGVMAFKMHGGPYMVAGLPDILGQCYGRFFAFEVKRPGGKATDHQLAMLQRFNDCGAGASIVYSLDEALSCLVKWGMIQDVDASAWRDRSVQG